MPLTCSTATAEWCSAPPSPGFSIAFTWLCILRPPALRAVRTDGIRERLKSGSVHDEHLLRQPPGGDPRRYDGLPNAGGAHPCRSEEHTSELQSRLHLVSRILLAQNK